MNVRGFFIAINCRGAIVLIATSTCIITMKIRCVVAATNSEGSPEFYPCTVSCTKAEYNDGEHYDLAKEKAEAEGYKAAWVCDENDPAFAAVSHLFAKKEVKPAQTLIFGRIEEGDNFALIEGGKVPVRKAATLIRRAYEKDSGEKTTGKEVYVELVVTGSGMKTVDLY